MSEIVRAAARWARNRHENWYQGIEGQAQFRKYDDRPYFEHAFEVATLVRAVGLEDEVVAAAYLHDTVEDTTRLLPNGDPDPESVMELVHEIQSRFGTNVLQWTLEVTDKSRKTDGNRAVRKQIDINHLSHASMEGKSIKLADVTINNRDIVECDPDFAQVWLKEKTMLLPVLRGGNSMLFTIACESTGWSNRKLAEHRGKAL
jgi:(p)ppGpp synthase/HD superfamily hydrolase